MTKNPLASFFPVTRAAALVALAGLVLAGLFIPFRSEYGWMNPVTAEQHLEHRLGGIVIWRSDKPTPLSEFSREHGIQVDPARFRVKGMSCSLFHLVEIFRDGPVPAIYDFTPEIQTLWMKNKSAEVIGGFIHKMNKSPESVRKEIVNEAVREALESEKSRPAVLATGEPRP